MPSYQDDPSFREEHTGPHLEGKDGIELSRRDPSPEQIQSMCLAIRKVCPRAPAGPRSNWTAPEVTETELGSDL